MKKRFLFVTIIAILIVILNLGLIACNGAVDIKLSFVVDGEIYHTIETKGDGSITLPNNPTKSGYVFDGWFWEDGRDFTANSLLDTPLSENMSVYARWRKDSYVVTFDGNGGDYISGEVTQTVEYGKSATAPVFAKEGYTLSWDKVFNNITSELTVTAVWTIKTYAVNFDGNGGNYISGEVTQTVEHGKTAAAPVFAKEGYTLSWDKVFNNITSELTVTAVWTIKTYAVNFDGNGGDYISGEVTQTVEYGKTATAPVFTKEGYTLSWDKVFNNITSELTVTAVWTVKTYTVNFNANGGVYVSGDVNQTIEHGKAATAPVYEKKGYTLFWNKSFDKITEETTVTAVWQIVIYEIEYLNLQGGINNNTVTEYTVETETIEFSAPVREGYTGTWDISSISKGSTGNVTTTASWQINFYLLSEIYIANKSKFDLAYGSSQMLSKSDAQNYVKSYVLENFIEFEESAVTGMVTLGAMLGSGGTYCSVIEFSTSAAVNTFIQLINDYFESLINEDYESYGYVFSYIDSMFVISENYPNLLYIYAPNLDALISSDSVSKEGNFTMLESGATLYHAFSLMHNHEQVQLPQSITKILDYAFLVHGTINNLVLPSRIEGLSVKSFYSLYGNGVLDFEIDSDKYKAIDGILCSSDGTTLIVAPVKNEIAIPISITTILSDSIRTSSYVVVGKNVTTIEKNGIMANRIYCLTDSKPDGWHENWYSQNEKYGNTVIFGFEKFAENASYEYFVTKEGAVITKSLGLGSYYDGNPQDLVLSTIDNKPIIGIDANAFESKNIKSVTLPNTIKWIGDRAFVYCNGLSEIFIPTSVEKMGFEPFMQNISVPNIVVYIQSVNIPQGWHPNWAGAHNNRHSIPHVVNVNEVRGTADFIYALTNNNEIVLTKYLSKTATLNIPDTIDGKIVVGIASICFDDKSVGEIIIPKTIKKIDVPFASDSGGWSSGESYYYLSKITVDPLNLQYKSVDGVLFSADMNSLIYFPAYSEMKSYTVPDGVITLESQSITYGQLDELFLPASVENIYNFVRYGGPGTKVFYMGKKGDLRIDNSINAGDISIVYNYKSSGVTESGLKYVTTNDGTVTIIGYSGNAYSDFPNYIAAISNIPATIDGKPVTAIGAYAFNIGSYFYGQGYASITLPSSIKEIGSHAFMYSGINIIYIPQGVESIGSYAFGNIIVCFEADSLPKNTDSSWKYWGENMQVYFGAELHEVDDIYYIIDESKVVLVFSSNTDVEIVVPSYITVGGKNYTVANIGNLAFQSNNTPFNVSSTNIIELPDTIEKIGYNAFSNYRLTVFCALEESEITFESAPNENSTTNNAMFYWGLNEDNYLYENGFHFLVKHGAAVLIKYSGDADIIVIPSSVSIGGTNYAVTEIAQRAFSNLLIFESVYIPESVQTIPSFSFPNTYMTMKIYVAFAEDAVPVGWAIDWNSYLAIVYVAF